MPVLTLNAQMFSYRSTSFLLTMGAGSRTANSLEYLFGVSGAAFDQRIITTVGGFVGPTTVLAGGAHVGDVIATNTVPTAKRTVLAFGIAMSARLLPWSSPEK